MMEQAHIYYGGIVQGVGFRFTVERLAKDLGLTGWVRNLADGRVEILAEGERDSLLKLIVQVEEHFQGYIRKKEEQINTVSGRFKDFRVTY